MRVITRNPRIAVLRQARLPDQLLASGCSQAHRLRYVALTCNCASNGSAYKWEASNAAAGMQPPTGCAEMFHLDRRT